MTNKTFHLRILAGALSALVIPLASFGALQTKTVQPTNMVGSTDKSGAVTFDDIPDFNPDLGELVAVKFSLDLEGTPFLEINNTTHHNQNFTSAFALESGKITLDIPTTGGTEKLTVDSGLGMIPFTSGTVSKKGTSGDPDFIYGSTNDTTKNKKIFDPTSLYSSTTAGATYDLDALFKEFPGMVGGSALPGVEFSGGEDLYSCLEVTYFYCNDPSVPEPSTWALGIFSIGALFLGRRLLVKRASLV